MTTITLPPDVPPAIRHRVYVRGEWGGAWVELPGIQCLEATWSVAPSIPTATLLWRYGPTKQPNQPNFFPETPTLLQDTFVRIDFECDDSVDEGPGGEDWSSVRQWFGIVRSTENQLPGQNIQAGMQVYQAVGLESLLAEHLVRATHWEDGSLLHEVDYPHPFNPSGVGNMTTFAVDGETRVYWYDLNTAGTWSTMQIIRYLLRYHTPLDNAGARTITFRINPDNPADVIPFWDAPEVNPRGQTTYSLLDRLMSRDRLLTWWLSVHSSGVVMLNCRTLADEALPVPIGEDAEIPANNRQRDLVFDADPMTSCAIKTSSLERADRVVCRGARRLSVGTFNVKFDETLEEGWGGTLQTEYVAAFSTDGSYGGLSRRLKQERNQEVRSQPEYAEVFAKFLVPLTWDRRTSNGQGGAKDVFYPVETPGGIGPTPYPVYPPGMAVLPFLPLIVGVDYTPSIGTVVVPESDTTEMEPLVAFKVPGTERWIQAEKIGQNARTERVSRNEPTFSVYTTIFQGLRGAMLRVSGGPQHAIAKEWFVKLPDDVDPGDYDAAEAVFTLSIPDDRFCEGQYPPESTVLDTTSAVRVKYIDAGEQYRRDYLAPATVVGVNTDGTLAISVDGGAIVNDTEALETLARIAYSWYGRDRNVMVLETPRSIPPEDLELGDLVTHVGTPATPLRTEIGSCISQISVRIPVGTGTEADAPVPRWRFVTAAGELDPIQVVPRAMTSTAKREVFRERERMRMRGVMRGEGT